MLSRRTRLNTVAALTVMMVMASGLAVATVQGGIEVAGKPMPALENPVVITKVAGDSEITRTWVAPANGYVHQWLENDGLKGIEVYTHDTTVKTKKSAPCSAIDISFVDADAYPTGTVQCGYFGVLQDHIYTWTFAPSGRVGASAQYFWSFEGLSGAPVADFTMSYTGTLFKVDAFPSYDLDGWIVSYQWNWGDGDTSSGTTASHQYADMTQGHHVTLTVTDNDGFTNSLMLTTPPPFPYTIYGYTTDSDGTPLPGTSVTITDVRTQQSVSGVADETYGIYMIDLNRIYYGWAVGDVIRIVATNGALSGAVEYTMTDPNLPNVQIDIVLGALTELPEANFWLAIHSSDWSTVHADGTPSSSPNGMIVSYEWDFGDGATATGLTADHTYSVMGKYLIKLTVTDVLGMQDSVQGWVEMTPPLQPFAYSIEGYTITADASAVTVPEGNIVSYAWDWGDATTGSGITATHTYAAEGTYMVHLIVTNDSGLNFEAIQLVTVPA